MSNKVYQIVTDRIVEALDKGVVPWSKPWKGGHALPYNMYSMNPEKGRFYQGVNVPLLWMSGYTDPRWLTYNQAKKNGIEMRSSGARGDTTRWFVALRYPPVAYSNSSPILTTKAPGTGGASTQLPSRST